MTLLKVEYINWELKGRGVNKEGGREDGIITPRMSGKCIIKYIIKQNINKIARKTYKPIHVNPCVYIYIHGVILLWLTIIPQRTTDYKNPKSQYDNTPFRLFVSRVQQTFPKYTIIVALGCFLVVRVKSVLLKTQYGLNPIFQKVLQLWHLYQW